MEDFYATYGRNLDLDKYTRLAARVCNRPYALLHLFEHDNQHTLAQYGTPFDVGFCMQKRDSICDYTAELDKGDLLCIPDTFVDSRTMKLPAVSGPPNYRWYLGTPLRNAKNKLIGALCVLDRSADGQEATQEMKESLVDLAECITTELELRADCNVALRAKKDFLTSVSHELRDPMHGISMGLELLSTSHTNPAEEKMAIDTVRKCSQSLEGLVDKILCINDKDSGGLSTSAMEIISVAEVVENVLDTAWQKSTQANGDEMKYLEAILDVQTELINQEFLFDRRSLTSIVLHLFNNATKFTKIGLISVQLRTHHCGRSDCALKDADHEALELIVTDTGCGMSPAFIDKAFDQFSQEDPLREGVGLGLSVVKKLIDNIQGTFSISSKIDTGSTVTATFCIAKADSSSQEETLKSQRLLDGKTYALSSGLSRDVEQTLQKYCTNLGMQRVDSRKADCVIQSCDHELEYPAETTIQIAHNPMQRRRNSAQNHSKITISLPIGPFKLRQALTRVVGLDTCRLLCSNLGTKVVTRGSPQLTTRAQTAGHSPDLPSVSSSPSPALPHAIAYQPAPIHKSPRVNHYNRTCLVVDDNPINVKILCAFLQKRGYLHSCAKDGVEAVAAARARPLAMPYDVILMDINMPNMNGVEATRHIREYQAKNKIRSSLIVAISGCSDAEQKTAMNLGMTHFFKKPVDLRKLTQFLDVGVQS